MNWRIWVWVTLLWALPAVADSSQTVQIRPWANGVSDGDRLSALKAFEVANAEFSALRFSEALVKYQEAVKSWNHPAISFNIAICLINLDRLVEARSYLEQGLTWGAAPLGDAAYLQGLTYRRLINSRLAKLAIVCNEPQTHVTLDGRYLFTAPGRVEIYILPGEHQIVAAKSGLSIASETVMLSAGQTAALELQLVADRIVPKSVKRWSPWGPSTMLVAGSVMTGIGMFAYLASSRSFAQFDEIFLMECNLGCSTDDWVRSGQFPLADSIRAHAETQRIVAYSMLSIGAATLAAGAYMKYLNSPKSQSQPNNANSTRSLLSKLAPGTLFSISGVLLLSGTVGVYYGMKDDFHDKYRYSRAMPIGIGTLFVGVGSASVGLYLHRRASRSAAPAMSMSSNGAMLGWIGTFE